MPHAEQLQEKTQLQLWGLEDIHKRGGDKAVREFVLAHNSEKAEMHAMKKELLWRIDRTKRSTLLHDFVSGVDELHFEMTHLDTLQEWGLWRFLSQHRKLLFESTFWLACLQNLVVLSRYSITDLSPTMKLLETLANDFMGCLQVLSCILSFVAVAVQSGPLLLKRKDLWREHDKFDHARESLWDRWDSDYARMTRAGDLRGSDASCWERAALVKDVLWLHLERLWLFARFLTTPLADMRLNTALGLLIAALLGLLVSPLWFVLHLLDVVNRSPDLQYVIRSVTTHGRSLLWTAAFGAIIIYIYAAAGYGLLPLRAFRETVPSPAFDGNHESLFGQGDDDRQRLFGQDSDEEARAVLGQDEEARASGNSNSGKAGRLLDASHLGYDGEYYCDNLLFCWLAALNEGLRSGDIGVLMFNPDPTDDTMEYISVMLYQFSFYCIVVTTLLSVIFGIIVDTFTLLRTEEQEKLRHMRNTCCMCGVDRLTLDTMGGGFEKHIRVEHNMWLYAFMLIHIRDKDPLDYNGWEADVASRLSQGDYSFIPSNNAISLKEYKERRKRQDYEVFEKVAKAVVMEMQQGSGSGSSQPAAAER